MRSVARKKQAMARSFSSDVGWKTAPNDVRCGGKQARDERHHRGGEGEGTILRTCVLNILNDPVQFGSICMVFNL